MQNVPHPIDAQRALRNLADCLRRSDDMFQALYAAIGDDREGSIMSFYALTGTIQESLNKYTDTVKNVLQERSLS
jgi:hypothetical protein